MRRQLLVLDVNLPRTTKRLRSIAAVPRLRWRAVVRLRSGWRVFLRPNHCAGLLRIARPHQQRRQCVQRVFELVVIGLVSNRQG